MLFSHDNINASQAYIINQIFIQMTPDPTKIYIKQEGKQTVACSSKKKGGKKYTKEWIFANPIEVRRVVNEKLKATAPVIDSSSFYTQRQAQQQSMNLVTLMTERIETLI